MTIVVPSAWVTLTLLWLLPKEEHEEGLQKSGRNKPFETKVYNNRVKNKRTEERQRVAVMGRMWWWSRSRSRARSRAMLMGR